MSLILYATIRCDGNYQLVIFESLEEIRMNLQKFSRKFQPKDHYFYAYLNMNGDQIAYVSHAAQRWKGVKFTYEAEEVCSADILQENHDHTENKLYIRFSQKEFSTLKSSLHPNLYVKFELKHSYFDDLQKSIKNLSNDTLQRLMLDAAVMSEHLVSDEINRLSPYSILCSSDQFEALKTITLTSSVYKPVLIIGPFGTGKTRILALASHFLLNYHSQQSRILLCTHQRVSADNFLETFLNLNDQLPAKLPLESHKVLLVRNYGYRNRDLKPYYVCSDAVANHIPKCDQQRSHISCLIVTTCLTAPHLAEYLTDKFFTHIMIDEGAQMREPEAVAPFCMANKEVQIVIAGDPLQVRLYILERGPTYYLRF